MATASFTRTSFSPEIVSLSLSSARLPLSSTSKSRLASTAARVTPKRLIISSTTSSRVLALVSNTVFRSLSSTSTIVVSEKTSASASN